MNLSCRIVTLFSLGMIIIACFILTGPALFLGIMVSDHNPSLMTPLIVFAPLLGVFITMVFAALDLLTLHNASPPLFYVHITGTVTLLVFLAAVSLRKPNRWIELLCFGAMITQIALLTTVLALSSSLGVVLSAYGAVDSPGSSLIRCLRRLIR